MKSKRVAAKILAFIAAWGLMLGSILGGVYFLVSSRWFYQTEFTIYDTAYQLNVENETLMEITDGLLSYIVGDRENLDMQAVIGGEEKEVFSQREKDHMVDVALLIQLALKAFHICAAVFVGCMILGIVFACQSHGGMEFCLGFVYGLEALLVVVGLVAVYFMVDFTSAFYVFHTIFFNNDLWLLPADSFMIQMVPEAFFMDCALVLGMFFLVALLASGVTAVILYYTFRRRAAREEALEDENDDALIVQSDVGSESIFSIADVPAERPDAERIFENLGLGGDDSLDDHEEDGLPFEEPIQEAPTQVEAWEAMAEPAAFVAQEGEEAPQRLAEEEMQPAPSIRLQMNLNLKVVRNGTGVELVADPSMPMDIRLSAAESDLKLLGDVQTAKLVAEGTPSLTIDPEPDMAPAAKSQIPAPEKVAMEVLADGAGDVGMQPPSVSELLSKVEELMKDFPSAEGEQ